MAKKMENIRGNRRVGEEQQQHLIMDGARRDSHTTDRTLRLLPDLNKSVRGFLLDFVLWMRGVPLLEGRWRCKGSLGRTLGR